MTLTNVILSSADTFRKRLQSIIGASISATTPNGMNMSIRMIYVVDTNCFPNCVSPSATASASLFFRPREKPTSKKLIHSTTEETVSHTPYSSSDRYPNVMGTRRSCTTILTPFKANDPTMFFFTFFDLPEELPRNLFFIFPKMWSPMDYDYRFNPY